jgi:cell shape-determining protein MreD
LRARIFFLAVVTLILQRVLGLPGMPAWFGHLLLPMIWIVAASLVRKERHWPYEALLLGLAWDLLFGPVVGPGGIAWTAACLSLYGLASVVADRSPKAWTAFGAVGTVVVILVQRLAVMPLGLESFLTVRQLMWSAILTGLWCGLVGLVLALDLGKHWRAHQVRKLR